MLLLQVKKSCYEQNVICMGWKIFVIGLLDPSQKRCPTKAKTFPLQVQEWIFAFCQGGQAFDEASVLLRYSTRVKSAAQRKQKQKDTLHLGPAVGAD